MNITESIVLYQSPATPYYDYLLPYNTGSHNALLVLVLCLTVPPSKLIFSEVTKAVLESRKHGVPVLDTLYARGAVAYRTVLCPLMEKVLLEQIPHLQLLLNFSYDYLWSLFLALCVTLRPTLEDLLTFAVLQASNFIQALVDTTSSTTAFLVGSTTAIVSPLSIHLIQYLKTRLLVLFDVLCDSLFEALVHSLPQAHAQAQDSAYSPPTTQDHPEPPPCPPRGIFEVAPSTRARWRAIEEQLQASRERPVYAYHYRSVFSPPPLGSR